MSKIAMAAFEVSGGQIVEHQAAFGKVPFRQCVFNYRLALQQPVHGAIQIVVLYLPQTQELTEAVAEGIGIKGAGRGQFGGGIEYTRDDHGHDEIALAARSIAQQAVKTELVKRTNGGSHMAVRLGAKNLKGLGGSGGDGGAFQNTAQGYDLFRRPVGEIGDGAVADLAVLAEGFPKEHGGRRIAVRHDRYIHVDMMPSQEVHCKLKHLIYMTTLI